MEISRYNDKHYPDPTAYAAMRNIHRTEPPDEPRGPGFRPLVYICSPYAGDVEANTVKARRYCRFAIDAHTIPVASHLLYPQVLDENDPESRQLGLFFGLVLLTKCRECWVFGYRITAGMEQEIRKAQSKGIPIRYFTEDMREVHVCGN